MVMSGTISKMVSEATTPVTYHLPIGEQQVALNEYIGKKVHFRFTGIIICRGCGITIKKSYQDGYCFPCTQRLACCDFCVLKPERCHFHLGTCRQPEWGTANCMIPHWVYLANSTNLKVGLTRHNQLPTRWIDQGAIQAVPIFKVPTRQVAGFVEVAIAEMVSDKSNWRALIREDATPIDMLDAVNSTILKLNPTFERLRDQWGEDAIQSVNDQPITVLEYPINAYPSKCKTLSLDKMPEVEETLLGIKGQYLFFEQGAMNMRRHQGYEIEWM